MSVSFNGTDGRITLGTNLPYLNGAAAASMTAWVLANSFAISRTIFGVAIGPPPGTTTDSRFQVGPDSAGVIRLFIRNQDADVFTEITGGTAMVAGRWTHVAATYEANTKVGKTFIDGVLNFTGVAVNATGTTFEATNSKNGAVGAEVDASTTNELWSGLIEDVRLYNRELGEGEIATIYAARGADGIVSGLQARFPMNELGEGASVASCANIVEFTRRAGAPLGTITYGNTSIIRGSRTKRMMTIR